MQLDKTGVVGLCRGGPYSSRTRAKEEDNAESKVFQRYMIYEMHHQWRQFWMQESKKLARWRKFVEVMQMK